MNSGKIRKFTSYSDYFYETLAIYLYLWVPWTLNAFLTNEKGGHLGMKLLVFVTSKKRVCLVAREIEILELNYLKYFHTVASELSFTRAAHILRIQQPTISKMVKQLENRLGIILIERDAKKLKLTKSGELIFEKCREIFEIIEKIEAISDLEQTDCYGPFAFGLTDSVCHYILPKILKGFLHVHPKVQPEVFSGASNLISNEIAQGRIEFGICFTKPESADFEFSSLGIVPFVVVVAKEKYSDPVVRQSFIISRDKDYPKRRPFPVLEMLQRNKIPVKVTISANNLDCQKQMVKMGLGVSLLPTFMVKQSIQRGELVQLYHNKSFHYPLIMFSKRNRHLTKNARTFGDYFIKCLPNFF